jgi:hypothetical protein
MDEQSARCDEPVPVSVSAPRKRIAEQTATLKQANGIAVVASSLVGLYEEAGR